MKKLAIRFKVSCFLRWFSLVITLSQRYYLCLRSLPVSLNPSHHSSLTSPRCFCLEKCHSVQSLSFFAPFCINPRHYCVWKCQDISSFWNMQTDKSIRSHFHFFFSEVCRITEALDLTAWFYATVLLPHDWLATKQHAWVGKSEVLIIYK